MLPLSELTRERLSHFKKIKRAYYSLWILGVAFILSLFSPAIANDKPIILWPLVKFYSAETFGGKYKTEANYLKLKQDPNFSGGMIMPPIPHNPIHAYLDLEGTPPHRPSLKHWLGTDTGARDVLSRLLHGFRICMLFSITITVLGAICGIIIGGFQGYSGGWVDIVFQRLIEIWSSLPFLYVIILVGAIYGRGFFTLIFVMLIFQWIGLSYYMRGEFLKHILPNALTPVITIIPFHLIGGISVLTALDFLGFGLPPPTPSWGELLDQGLKNLHSPWIAISTIAALMVTLLLATFIGEGVREVMDPKSGSRFE